jgi:hypothetical protein
MSRASRSFAWGLVCALLVEPTKAAAHGVRARAAVYALLVVYQIVLVGDTIRAHAFDWWRWVLWLAGLITLPTFSIDQDVASFHFPWISCASAIAAAVAVFRSTTNGSHRRDAAAVTAPKQPPPALGDRTSRG